MTHMLNPPITATQTQTIYGTILGGSSLVRPKNGVNCYLSMRSKNPQWLEYKGGILASLASPKPYTVEKTYRWHSLCYPVFRSMYDQFYKNGDRCLSPDVLELLGDTALAVWYGDCGTYTDDKVELNTNVWGKSGNKVICTFFKSLDYKFDLIEESEKYRIRLDAKSSNDFLRAAQARLPAWFFQY